MTDERIASGPRIDVEAIRQRVDATVGAHPMGLLQDARDLLSLLAERAAEQERLVKQWRERIPFNEDAEAAEIKRCADELEALIGRTR